MKLKTCLHLAVFASVALGASLVFYPLVVAQESVQPQVPLGINTIIYNNFDSKLARSYMKTPKALFEFYAARNFKPVWSNSSGVNKEARALVDLIEKSWEHGLNPYSYHLENIYKFLDTRDEPLLADLDVLLSDAYVRLARDLTGIRVDPSSLKSNKKFWKTPLAADYVLGLLQQNSDASALIHSFEPKGRTYEAIQAELVALTTDKAFAYEAVLPIRVNVNVLRPMDRNEAVRKIRVRLDVPAFEGSDPTLYDDRVAAAVIRFQRENGLKDDGIIGGQTLDIMNISHTTKIEQLIANLERLRWVEEEKPNKFVVVNVPSATLWAVEGGKVAFEMPVIVGTQKRPTNIFRTTIDGIRFNPNWTVPPTIKKDDILPKLRDNPDYLSSKGMDLLNNNGQMLNPASLDWQNMSEQDLRSLSMVQKPGLNNPLGRVRVLMPNAYNIYLHDTNDPSYFDRANRAASSGCVRMKYPEQMANFVMSERAGWTPENTQSYIEEGRMRDVFIQNPIPVYLLYYTVWIGEDGALVFGSDLYGFDDNLIKLLKDLDGIFIPVDNNRL